MDINLEIPVSAHKENIPFYVFNEKGLNTFSQELAKKHEDESKGRYRTEETINLTTDTFTNILEKYLPKNTEIDFLTIDAEGFDFKILQSNNWKKYRPKIILVENDLPLLEFINSKVYQFMQTQDYIVYAKTVKTYFLKENNFNM